ncbi:MAG: helix-turn-helix domain-containing protein [Opitutaceae bacterium]|nr:helix-turn-helix domain-containing protein [Opitutaceae bacterium]
MAISVMRRRDYTGRELGLDEIQQVGHTVCSRAHAGLPAHAHVDCIEICYLRKGQLHWWTDNEEEVAEVKAGELVVTHPGKLHGGVDNIHEACDLYWISFISTPERFLPGLEKKYHRLIYERLLAAPRHFPGIPKIVDYFEQMLTAIEFPGPLSPMRVRSAFHQLLLEICDCASTDYKKKEDPRFEEIIAKVKTDVTFFGDVPDMAERVGLSCNRFITLFRRYTGYTPMDFLTRERIQQAKQLLAERSNRVTDVAFHLDFSSTQYFATVFKKFTGMTPSQYQRETLG